MNLPSSAKLFAMYSGLVTQELVTKIATDFREHNLEAIVNSFADDGKFINAKGPTVSGDTYSGKNEIRGFFTNLFATLPDVRWDRVQPDWICGDRAVTQWHRKGTNKDGVLQEWLGIDLYMFDGTLIKRKD